MAVGGGGGGGGVGAGGGGDVDDDQGNDVVVGLKRDALYSMAGGGR